MTESRKDTELVEVAFRQTQQPASTDSMTENKKDTKPVEVSGALRFEKLNDQHFGKLNLLS